MKTKTSKRQSQITQLVERGFAIHQQLSLLEKEGKHRLVALQLEYSLVERNIEREHVPLTTGGTSSSDFATNDYRSQEFCLHIHDIHPHNTPRQANWSVARGLASQPMNHPFPVL